MDGGFDKNQTITDYAALLGAILPDAIGFYCVDRKGRKFFDRPPADPVELSSAYTNAVQTILESPERAAEVGCIELGIATAMLVPLETDQHRILGVLTILIKTESELTYASCLEQAQAAIRSLQRELTLRFRLLIAYRKLNVRSAEENLMHQVEQLVHEHRSCEVTLSHILLLTRKFLGVKGVSLLIPDKHIQLFDGDGVSPIEARLLLSDMAEPLPFEPNLPESMGDQNGEADSRDAGVDGESNLLALPVRHDGLDPVGVFVLSGWGDSEFSARRRKRIARYLVAHIQDIVARDYDALTGLMSWPLFDAKFLEICGEGEARAAGETFIFYFDVDQFHVINESFGPESGDEILASFARLLRDRMGANLVTRITGDTFAALMLNTDLKKARTLAEEISLSFGQIERVRGTQTLRSSVSAGLAPVTELLESASAALAPAQTACRAAKERGRGRVETYQSGDASIIQRVDDIQLVGHVRNAIENGRLLITAQPIVPLTNDRDIHYFEVLTRLVDSSGGQVMPSDFFSAAERYHLMEELDRVVIKQTFEMLTERKAGLDGLSLRIAINLSGQSLGSESFLDFVEQQIEAFNIPPEMLCFEITETVAIANLQRAQTLMHALKRLGCYFSLDDFGTGLSSFAYLKLFPVDTLKIDGSFVRDIVSNHVSQSVVAAISELARVMQLETVAEYVQDKDSLSLLKDMGVNYGQGFLLGEPKPLEQRLDQLIRSPQKQQIPA